MVDLPVARLLLHFCQPKLLVSVLEIAMLRIATCTNLSMMLQHRQQVSRCCLNVYDVLRLYRGHSFFSTNAELLDRYAACATASEVIQVQTDYLDQLSQASARVPAGQSAGRLL